MVPFRKSGNNSAHVQSRQPARPTQSMVTVLKYTRIRNTYTHAHTFTVLARLS